MVKQAPLIVELFGILYTNKHLLRKHIKHDTTDQLIDDFDTLLKYPPRWRKVEPSCQSPRVELKLGDLVNMNDAFLAAVKLTLNPSVACLSPPSPGVFNGFLA